MFPNVGGRREGEASSGFAGVLQCSRFCIPKADTADGLTHGWGKTKQRQHRARGVCEEEGSSVLM